MKPWATCSALSYGYGIPAVNTWPVGRHMALLNKIINDKIGPTLAEVSSKDEQLAEKAIEE